MEIPKIRRKNLLEGGIGVVEVTGYFLEQATNQTPKIRSTRC